jgi:hypothetical protein
MGKEIQKKSDVVPALLVNYADGISDGTISKKNCKLCQSPSRVEVEEKFLVTNSFTAASRILEKNGEDIDYSSVRRHLMNHLIVQQQQMAVKEYASQISSILKEHYNIRTQILERIKIMNRKMYVIEAMTEGQTLDEMRRSADAIKKLVDTIASAEKDLQAIDQTMQPVQILINNFKNIIQEELKKTNSDDVKEVIKTIWNKLIHSVEEEIVPKG